MRTMFVWKKSLLRSVVIASALGLGALTSSAGTYTNDFNIDPVPDDLNFSLRASAVWRAAGSFDGSGYVSITDAVTNLQGTFVLPDIDPGSATKVAGFRFYAKVRIGGGTARPADGFSISFVPSNDGLVTAGTTGEDGPRSGLVVSFDTWDNRSVSGVAFAGDGPAIDIKHNGAVVAHKLFAGDGSRGVYCSVVETDASGIPISIETDPAGTAAPGTWVDLEIILSPGGTLSLNYKGHPIYRDIVTGYAPGPGRFVIGARTGGATDNHWIDNIGIITDVLAPPPRAVFTNPRAAQADREGFPGYRDIGELTPISFVIDSSLGVSQVDPASINLTLNGIEVTSSAVVGSPAANQTSITYTPPGLGYAPGSKQEAVLTYREDRDPRRAVTVRNTFFVTPVPAATALGTTLFIEAEDFNYSDGTTHGQFFDFPTPNAAYDALPAQHTIDYSLAFTNIESPLYRVLIPNNGISQAGDNLRAGTPIALDYKVGWNDPGDWFNFTRTFPNTTYKIYGRFSSGGANSQAQLARVTSDRTVSPQDIALVGTFGGLTTGHYDAFCFIPLRNVNGAETIIRFNGLTTLRLTALPGNYDCNYLAFVPTFSPTAFRPYLASTIPVHGTESVRDPLIKVVVTDGDTAVVPGSIRVFLGTNELPPLVVTDTISGAEAQFQVTELLPAGSSLTASVMFTDDDANPVTQTNTFSFTVSPLKGGAKTLFIEAEDFNFSADGVAGGQFIAFGPPACSLRGSNAIVGVDYQAEAGHPPASDGFPPDGGYRSTTGADVGKPGGDGFERPGRTVACDYIVGWNDPSEWYNYTRDFGPTSKRYNVFGRLASGGNPEAIEWARITSDRAQPNQTKEIIGEFRSPASGSWDVFHYVPLRDASGNVASLRLSGVQTFRASFLPGNVDVNYFAFVEADVQFVPSAVTTVEPRPDSDYARAPRITATLRDQDSAVVLSSVRLFFDGTDVTSFAAITDTPSGIDISYQAPTGSPAGTVHTVRIQYGDNQPTPAAQNFQWSYREGIYNAESNLFIETEDYNTAGGQFIPSSLNHPFNEKGQYSNLPATAGIDFNDDGGGDCAAGSCNYRPPAVGIPQVATAPLSDSYRTGAGPRPGFEVVSDYKIGWTSPDVDWYNYTRDFGAGGSYNVYLRAAHGDTAAGITIGGRLDHVDDPLANTTITNIGNFRAPATGGWDTFTFIPLKDGVGNVVNIPLSGVRTLRYTVEANGGDVNYLMFVPAAPVGPRLTVTHAGSNVTITWPSGNLQSAPAITGPWTTEAGATSPLQLNSTTGMRFYRTITP